MAKLILRFFITLVISVGFSINIDAQCSISTIDDTSVCSAASGIWLQTTVSGAMGYTWTPANGLSNTSSANPIARPTSTTQYIVTAIIPDNTELVTNGNFESGNTGFSSSYAYRANPTPVTNNLLEGQYTVKTNPSLTHQCFAGCGDKTSGSGNMMILNGSKTANVSVWSQTISVTPNTDYVFSAWLQNVTCPPYGFNAALQFSINGSLIGNVFNSESTVCRWKQFYQLWNSGNSTTAIISVVNQYTNADGNDFALDDISFRKLCLAKDSVTITIGKKTTKNVTICNGDSIFLQNGYRKTAGTYYDTISIGSCDTFVTTHLSLLTNSINSTDTTICSGDSINFDNKYYSSSGIYRDTLSAAGACYNINIMNLTVVNETYQSISKLLCGADSFYFDNRFIKSSGTYFDTVYRKHCIDTLKRLDLTIKVQPVTHFTFRVCPGDSIFWEGSFIKTDTVLYDSIAIQNGCDSVVITTINVIDNALLLPDTTFYCENIALVDAGVFRSYLWSDGTTGRFLTTTTNGIYWVQITDTNNCKFSDTALVLERCDPRLFIPSSFTPNNDGKNDSFSVYTYNIYGLNFKIFDRWGEIIFEARDPSFVWDGTYNGAALPTGIYHWLASFSGYNREGRIVKQAQKGMIMLIR